MQYTTHKTTVPSIRGVSICSLLLVFGINTNNVRREREREGIDCMDGGKARRESWNGSSYSLQAAAKGRSPSSSF